LVSIPTIRTWTRMAVLTQNLGWPRYASHMRKPPHTCVTRSLRGRSDRFPIARKVWVYRNCLFHCQVNEHWIHESRYVFNLHKKVHETYVDRVGIVCVWRSPCGWYSWRLDSKGISQLISWLSCLRFVLHIPVCIVSSESREKCKDTYILWETRAVFLLMRCWAIGHGAVRPGRLVILSGIWFQL